MDMTYLTKQAKMATHPTRRCIEGLLSLAVTSVEANHSAP
jgi:hypothetical protein